MPAVRTVLWVVPVVLFVGLLASPLRGGPQPPKSAEPSKPGPSVDVEVKYVDNSDMKLKLLDDKLELVTKHGVLRIAVADIRRIEFATRVPTDVAEKVALAISKLNHSDFKAREAATDELKILRERAYAPLLKSQKSEDPEVARRSEEIIAFIKNKVSSANLEQREFDVIETSDSKIAGKLSAEMLRVGTFQFGEQQLKLTDVRSIRTGANAPAEDLTNAIPGPAHLANYQNQFGKEFVFSVTGVQAGGQGNLWGQDVYTLDSSLPTAVVHAGLAKPGETVLVRVRIIVSPPAFAGTVRNGITSTAYNVYPAGAYEFVRK